jgi:hypothetical protein
MMLSLELLRLINQCFVQARIAGINPYKFIPYSV